MPSQWNMFVKKIYQEGKAKDSSYEFKQALKDASKRKSEMGKMKMTDTKSKLRRKSRKTKTRGKRHHKKTRKNRK